MHAGITVSAIAAIGRNGEVGKDGGLPWRIPNDLKWFKSHTKGHALIMGRKTRDELGKPLKRRLNIVLSRTLEQTDDGFVICRTLDEALDAAAEHERQAVAEGRLQRPEAFVIGGPMIWSLSWDRVDRFYRTDVQADFEADTFFPDLPLEAFEEIERSDGTGDIPHVFVVLQRTGRATKGT